MPILNLRNTAGEFEPIPAMIGPQGAQGVPGPNEITTATATPLSGVLVGKDGHVKEGEPGVDFAAVEHAAQHAADGDDPITPAAIGAATALQANTTVHVSPFGSDTTGDGSAGNPWATVQKAVDMCPQIVAPYTYTINIGTAAGQSFPGFDVRNKQINITSSYNPTITGQVSARGCTGQLQIDGTITVDGTVNGIVGIYGGTIAIMASVTVRTTSASPYNAAIDAAFGGSIYCNSGVTITFASGCTRGVYAASGGRISLLAIAGSVSATLFYADIGGMITFTTNTATYGTQYTTAAGGRIYTGAQSSVPNY